MSGGLERAREVVGRLRTLGKEPVVLRKACARALAELSPTDAVNLLYEVLVLARSGSDGAHQVLPAFVRALELEPEVLPHVEALRRVAALDGRREVEALFSEGAPQREYDPDAAARADAKLFSAPLGWLKTEARLTRNPDELARYAVASNPAVVREVLRNPRLTEELVVRIASRRPARPEPLTEIWRSPRWSSRPAVQRALVFNPYLPPDVGSKLVPLLSRSDLVELVADGSLHRLLRDQAGQLLEAGVQH